MRVESEAGSVDFVAYAFTPHQKREIKKHYGNRDALTGVKESSSPNAEKLQVHHRLPTRALKPWGIEGTDDKRNGVPLFDSSHRLIDELAIVHQLIFNPETNSFETVEKVREQEPWLFK